MQVVFAPLDVDGAHGELFLEGMADIYCIFHSSEPGLCFGKNGAVSLRAGMGQYTSQHPLAITRNPCTPP